MHLFFISTGDFTCVLFVIMRNIIVIVLCTVFVCVRSDCDDPDCVETVIRQILDNETVTDEFVDLKLEVPEFKQLKNIEIKDVNSIILSLTKWFENKLNESNYVYTAVKNKTKIFVKSFDFNVDFEHGNARIDMGLAKGPDVTAKNNVESVSEESLTVNETTSTTVDPSIEIDNLSNKITEAIGNNIKAAIKSQNNLKANDIYNTMDFDTTYYDQNEDKNSTDYPMIDYIDLYKDTTNEEYLYTGTEFPTTLADLAQKPNEVEDISFESLLNDTTTFTNTVFPWVATIFIKNSTDNSQFHYYCDGALLSEKVILTGGRCVHHSNGLVAPENILVFLGKANLQSMGGNEKLHRVKSVVLHHNFTMDYMSWAVHDLALLILDVAAVFDDRVQSACLHNNLVETAEVEEAATTSWGPSGQLLPIFFEKQRSEICLDKTEDIFCATYGANVPLCPNYGGIYVAKRMSRWCVQGLFYGDPSYRGLCYNKNVLFTSLRNYYDWIDDYIVINANIL